MKDLHQAVWLVAFLVIGMVATNGCGEGELVFPGDIPATATGTPVETPACLPSGDACSLAADCCSGQCVTVDGENFFCQ